VTGSVGIARLATPIGELTIVCTPRGVAATVFDDDPREPTVPAIERRLDDERSAADGDPGGVARDARREAAAYFRDGGSPLTVPPDLVLAPGGFGRRVLDVVATIPSGELWTYGDVAGMAGSPRAARAAGSALANCPIELFVPCHRVVHAGGSLGGYGRHEDRKRWLIRHEGTPA
jgi:methylated-DNA-[protein]-cysteine S-methyltransferase